jgi:hypothetical protein
MIQARNPDSFKGPTSATAAALPIVARDPLSEKLTLVIKLMNTGSYSYANQMGTVDTL